MKPSQISELAEKLASGQIDVEQFVHDFTGTMTANVGDAAVDLDRHRRCGFPEVIFAEGKTNEALKRIIPSLLKAEQPILVTRVTDSQAADVISIYPQAQYNALARTLRISAPGPIQSARQGRVVIVTAGTSDRPIAEEARETLDWMNVKSKLVQDVGVAGPHRLPAHLETLEGADAVVVIAGMEGALPSIVGGYVACPVIGVPTSIGYGASFGGVSALLGMLNSCAANVTVVNIDAGFKGAYVAGLIAQKRVEV